MKVRATQKGFYGDQIRNEGDVFTLIEREAKGADGNKLVIPVEKQFSHRWMAEEEPRKRKPGPKPKVE